MDINNYIYGRNSVIEALNSQSNRINKILISQNVSKDTRINEIIKLAKENNVIFQFVPKEKFKDLALLPHQGVAAYVSPVKYHDIDEFLSQKDNKNYKKLVILDGVEDPHNFGAIARTALCAEIGRAHV